MGENRPSARNADFPFTSMPHPPKEEPRKDCRRSGRTVANGERWVTSRASRGGSYGGPADFVGAARHCIIPGEGAGAARWLSRRTRRRLKSTQTAQIAAILTNVPVHSPARDGWLGSRLRDPGRQSPGSSDVMHHRDQWRRRRAFNEPGHAHSLTFSCDRRYRFLAAERSCVWLAEAIERARMMRDFALRAFVLIPNHAALHHPAPKPGPCDPGHPPVHQAARRSTSRGLSGDERPAVVAEDHAGPRRGPRATLLAVRRRVRPEHRGARSTRRNDRLSASEPHRTVGWSHVRPIGGGPARDGTLALHRLTSSPTRSLPEWATD